MVIQFWDFHDVLGKSRNQRWPLCSNHDAITTKYDVRTLIGDIFTLTFILIALILAELSDGREEGFSPPSEDETKSDLDMVSLNEDLLSCNFSIAESSVTTISMKSISILFRI